jgi:eukaryotic-like serine/threonine-protein kinase
MSLKTEVMLRFDDCIIDPARRSFSCSQRPIPLSPKSFDLLAYLAANSGRVVTKDELLTALWPDSFVEEGNLTQHVFMLRKALASHRLGERIIVTVPGRGYQFAARVEVISPAPARQEISVLRATESITHVVIEEEEDDGAAAAAPPLLPPPPGGARRQSGRRMALAGVLALAAVASWAGWRRFHRQAARDHCAIVLADFTNTTGDLTFDTTLKKALEIDLGQSPYMDVMSEQETVNTLQRMGRKADAAIAGDTAKEVCERSNRQALLTGSIASLGREYLLTLEATDCVSGKELAQAKAEAASKEKVLGALDSITDQVRQGLGESAKSVERFQVPIAQATTSSLEALKAYSIGEYLVGRAGKEETETLPLFQRAVELDPKFAMAYAAIATDYYNLSEYNLAMQYYQKAFDLSDQVGEKEKLYIRAHYYADDLKDIEQGIKEYQLWAETYPRDWGPWTNIANQYTQLGQYGPSITAGEQALKLDPARGIIYSVLARAYMRVNRYADAKSAGARDIAIGKDSYGLHATLFEIAFAEHDQAAMSREIAWGRGKPSEWYSLYIQACAAAALGRHKQSEELFQAAYQIAEHENLAETADNVLIDQALVEVRLGLPRAARATLSRVKKQDADTPDLAILRAELRDIPATGRFLAAHSGKSEHGTLMNYVYLPRIRATLALQHSRPLDAVAALEPAVPYELADYTVSAQLGAAYLQARQGEKAAAEYRKILANPGIDPISPLYPMAHLGLAHAYVLEGNQAAARSEYHAFLDAWKNADPDLPVLHAAKGELTQLEQAKVN